MSVASYNQPWDEEEQNKISAIPGTQGTASASGVATGATSAGVATPVAGGTSGAGGANAFANIQNYLSANKGNQASTELLKNTAGAEIGKEQQAFSKAASEAEKTAQDFQNKFVNQDQASQMLAQAGGQYFNQGDIYNQNKARVQTALNLQQPTAQNFTYSVGQKAKDYGNALKAEGVDANKKFTKNLQDIYAQQGASLNQGQSALQSQLDLYNPELQQARADLYGQYSGLVNEADVGKEGSKAYNVNKLVQDVYGQAPKMSSDLRNYLNKAAGENRQAVQNRATEINDLTSQLRGDIGRMTYKAPDRSNREDLNWRWNEAGLENATGVEQQRGAYNTAQDWLGAQDRIAQSSPFDLSSISYKADPNVGARQSGLGSGTALNLMAAGIGGGKNFYGAPVTFKDIMDYWGTESSQNAPVRFHDVRSWMAPANQQNVVGDAFNPYGWAEGPSDKAFVAGNRQLRDIAKRLGLLDPPQKAKAEKTGGNI